MAKSSIEWTDNVWNPITGCSHASAGCLYCYAESVSHRFQRTVKPWTANNIAENLQYHPERYPEPIKLRKPSVIFTCSMGDLYHESADWDELAVIHGFMVAAKRHRFLALTKRPGVAAEFLRQHSPIDCWRRAAATYGDMPAPDTSAWESWDKVDWLWLGTSAEDQRNYEVRVPQLLEANVAHRFISAEPLLDELDLMLADSISEDGYPLVEWVIAGGESGGSAPRALLEQLRPLKGLSPTYRPKPTALAWVRSIRDQCESYGVDFHFKQWGGRTHSEGGRLLDGKEYDANPARASLTQTDAERLALSAPF